jgi:hypothetical protein
MMQQAKLHPFQRRPYPLTQHALVACHAVVEKAMQQMEEALNDIGKSLCSGCNDCHCHHLCRERCKQ